MLTVNIRERDGGERRLVFGTEEVTIGRAKGSDILLPRNNISKRHARLVDKDDKVVLVDLRSTNGTYVNGRRITAPEVVGPKDKIYIGDFVMKVESVASPQHEHTMPQSPVTETAMMDPAPLDGDNAPADDAPAGELDGGIEISDLEPELNTERRPENPQPAGSTDPGLGAEAAIEAAPEEAEEATAALDLDDLGLSADEVEEVALAPTRHRGMEEEAKAQGDDPEAPVDEPPEEDDDGIAFEEFEIDIDDDAFDGVDPEDAPATRQVPPPQVASAPAGEEAPDTRPGEEAPTTPEPSAAPEVSDEGEPSVEDEPTPEPADPVVVPTLCVEAIDTMLSDVTVEGIQINAFDSVAVRRGAQATTIPGSFEGREALSALARSLAGRAGVELSEEHITTAQLPGDISLRIIPSSIAPEGPVITLSRASAKRVSAQDLVEDGTFTEPIREALEAAVKEGKNIVVVADHPGDASTILGALSHFASPDARVAIIEAARELSVPQANSLRISKSALEASGDGLMDIVPPLNADHILIDPMSAEDVVEFVGLILGGHRGLIMSYKGRSANAVLRRMSLAVELALGTALGERARDMVSEAVDLIVVVDHSEGGVVIREVITVDDAGPSGFRTSEILAYS